MARAPITFNQVSPGQGGSYLLNNSVNNVLNSNKATQAGFNYFRDNNIADFKKLGQDNTADLVANINSLNNLDTLQAEYQNSLSQMPTTNFDKQLATEALMKRQGVLQASAVANAKIARDNRIQNNTTDLKLYEIDAKERDRKYGDATKQLNTLGDSIHSPWYAAWESIPGLREDFEGQKARLTGAGYDPIQTLAALGTDPGNVKTSVDNYINANQPSPGLSRPNNLYLGERNLRQAGQAQSTPTAQTTTQATQGQGTNKTAPVAAKKTQFETTLGAVDAKLGLNPNATSQNTPAVGPDVTVSPGQGNTQAPRTLEEEARLAKLRTDTEAQINNQATNEAPFIGQDPYLTPEIAAANERADWLKRNDAANAAFKADVISVKDAAYNAAIEPIVKKATQAYDYVANTKLDGTRAFPERDARIAKEKDDDLIASQQLNQAIQRNARNDLTAGIPIPDGSPRIPGTNNEIAQILSNTAISQEPVQTQTQLPAAQETPIYDEAIMAKEKYMSTVYPDQGADAIGYGHRLTGEEKLTGNIMVNGEAIPYANGQFTEEIARAKFKEDMAGKRKIVSKTWEGFNSLNPLDQRVITELGFNTKDPVNKKNWPELWKGMQMPAGPARVNKILQEIMRSYEKSDGTREELTDRVSALRQAYRSAV